MKLEDHTFCRELWCRSQMWLGFGMAVAVVQAGSCSYDLTPSLGTSICFRGSLNKKKEKKEKKKISLLLPTGFGCIICISKLTKTNFFKLKYSQFTIQYCISFRCTAKVIQLYVYYMVIYIIIFIYISDSFPLYIIMRY